MAPKDPAGGGLLPVKEALAKVRGGFRPLGTEEVPLARALGRVLAADVTAAISHPPDDVSAMDGYAVRAADVASVPATLTLIGESAAGRAFSGAVGPGECARIFTGAPMPEGADAIVIQEDTDSSGKRITVKESSEAGAWVRPAGLDFEAGDVLLQAGRVLTARDVGLAASMSQVWLSVRRKPVVAILSTGDELKLPGQPLGPDQIVNSNSVTLEAIVEVLGGTPRNLGIAEDTPDALTGKLADLGGVDLLVTTGGASVGDYDLVQQVLGREGFELGFYKIAMRPGKPLIFGHVKGVPVLGLPGNPVSAVVTSALFVRTAMQAMLGIPEDDGPRPTARLGRDLPAGGKREDYMRATLARDADGALVATPFGRQDSSMLANLAHADCLVVRRADAPAAAAGETVEIMPLGFGNIGF